jgi:hypothetical protein
VKTTDAQLKAKIQSAERALRLVWVIAFGAIVFSMLTVTPLVQRVTPDGWDKTAPLLPLVVDAAVIIVVRMDATISSFNVKGGAWPTILRWMTGVFTLLLNIGDSALKGDMVGVGVHAVCPLLLIATSEAIPRYRRTIASAAAEILREQAAERARREQQREAREHRERQEREQAQARREQLQREQQERAERQAREQREHEARLAQQARDHQAALEREKEERAEAARQADLDRQERIRLAEIASQERREQSEREEQRLREQAALEEKTRREAVREQQQQDRREHPEPTPAPVREHRPLHAVNTQTEAPVNTRKAPAANTDKLPEAAAVNMIREAVNSGQVSVRGLARETGWSPAWVSGQVAELRGDVTEAAAAEDAQVSA